MSLLRRSSSPTGSSIRKAAEASAAQPTAESVRVAGGTAAKGRPTPKRREAEAGAAVPPRSAEDPARGGQVREGEPSPKEEQRGNAAADRRRRAGMARGEDKYLLPRDRGPVRAYIRDVVDSRPHLIGPVHAAGASGRRLGAPAGPAVQQYLSLFSLI